MIVRLTKVSYDKDWLIKKQMEKATEDDGNKRPALVSAGHV